MTENNKSGHTRVGVQALMEDIRAEVARKRQANEYPEEWFEIADTDADDPERRDDLEANLRRANETVLLDRAQAFPEGSAGERAAGFVKRAIRRAILFHTNYLADQADKHNAAVVRTLNKLHQAVEELRRRSANTGERGRGVRTALGRPRRRGPGQAGGGYRAIAEGEGTPFLKFRFVIPWYGEIPGGAGGVPEDRGGARCPGPRGRGMDDDDPGARQQLEHLVSPGRRGGSGRRQGPTVSGRRDRP